MPESKFTIYFQFNSDHIPQKYKFVTAANDPTYRSKQSHIERHGRIIIFVPRFNFEWAHRKSETPFDGGLSRSEFEGLQEH